MAYFCHGRLFFLLLVAAHRRRLRADFTELSRNARFADSFQSIRNRQGSLSFVRTIHEDRESHAGPNTSSGMPFLPGS